MAYFFVVVFSILMLELCLTLPFKKRLMLIQRLSKQVLFILSAKVVSDYKKERYIPLYAFKLFVQSLFLLLYLLLLASVVYLVELTMLYFNQPFFDLMIQPLGLALTLCMPLLYLFVRGRFRE